MDYRALRSIPSLFFSQARALRNRPFLWAKHDGRYRAMTWGEVDRAVRDLSRGLRSLGIEPGDRVALVSENRPEWMIADLAIMAARAITVPAYTTNTESDHLHVLTDSEAKAVIVSTGALGRRLLPAAVRAPSCQTVIAMADSQSHQAHDVACHSWDEIMARGGALQDDVEEIADQAERDDVCCFIYTSGTGGTPKGVMLSHGNIFCNCQGAYDLLKSFGLSQEVFISFLPLSHSYEHTAGEILPISIGAEIYFAESVETLLSNLSEVRPTLMTAVPRLYETMYQRINREMGKQSPFRQRLFALAVDLGRKRYLDPASLSLKEKLLDLLVDRLVRAKVRSRFGGRLKAMVSGGAALNPDIGLFFTALGLRIMQGYGQTEASPVICANRPQRIKMHTVGPPLTGVELRIAEDGEILVRGELVMKGYWKQPEATAQVLRDGWLHTGDIGELDEDRYLTITDRKKDIVVLSGGDNVSPARIEGFLTLRPEIAQAMVFGDKRPHLVALLVPDPDWLREWARSAGKPRELPALVDDEALHAAVSKAVDAVNRDLSNLEKIRRFIIAPEAFSVDNEMLTPTMKIRRHVIRKVYGAALEALYQTKTP